MGKLRRKIKRQFIAGLLVILPLGLTLWLAWAIFKFIGRSFLPYLDYIPRVGYLPYSIRMVISALITLLIIWGVGFWASNFAGRFFIGNLDRLLLKAPFISKIYSTMKQLTSTVLINRKAFKKTAIIEYPRRGLGTLVFVTGEDIRDRAGRKLTSVFVPSTPNPTTGYCILLPEEEVTPLSISVNQAIEFIFSGGIMVPEGMEIPDILSVKEEREEL